jgi:hypothetical protein
MADQQSCCCRLSEKDTHINLATYKLARRTDPKLFVTISKSGDHSGWRSVSDVSHPVDYRLGRTVSTGGY